MANSIRSEISEIYAVSGYSVVDNPTTMTLTATRSLNGRRQEVAIAFPLEMTPRVRQEQILEEIAAWKPDGRDRIFVVALPKSLSLGAEFQSQVTSKGGKLRHYAGIDLPGFFGPRLA